MGKAVIVENKMEGLYSIRLLYDNAPLEKARDALQKRLDEMDARIEAAWLTIRDVQRDAEAAILAMNAVVDQYIQGLLDGLHPPPPLEPPVGNDPDTGQPWENPDRAQDVPLLDAINAARSAAGKAPLARVAELDRAVLRHLRDCAEIQQLSHFGPLGTTPENRVSRAGYAFSAEIGVGELLTGGQSSALAAVSDWLRRREDVDVLTADAPDVGVAFLYSGRSPYGYHWGAVIAAPGTVLETEVKTDPAKAAAEEADARLREIQTPDANALPQQLAAVCAEAARAAQKKRVAEEALAKLKMEQTEMAARLAKVNAALGRADEIMDAWCCMFYDTLQPGIEVITAEVPGFWRSDYADARTTTMGVRFDPGLTIPDTITGYIERYINIVPPWLGVVCDTPNLGQLRYAEALSDAGVFVNAALEPAHLRYKPLWRYGVITSRGTGNVAAGVTLEPIYSRELPNEPPMALDDAAQRALTNVPIFYPDCHGSVFFEDDTVLVMFPEHDREHPKIVGFRREPRHCLSQRIWIG